MVMKRWMLPEGMQIRTLPFGIGRGLKLGIDFQHHTKIYLGLYEIELNRHLRDLTRDARGCFDVGGQHGYDALILAKLTQHNVVTFDCDRDACDQMRRNLDANGGVGQKVKIRQAFVGKHTNSDQGILALDDVAFDPAYFVPDFVKIDIEGAEYEALQGMERLLRERAPGLLIETHSLALERQCDEFLRERGYSTLIVHPRRWAPDYRPIEHNRWLVAKAARPGVGVGGLPASPSR
jgi:hypothetical protein